MPLPLGTMLHAHYVALSSKYSSIVLIVTGKTWLLEEPAIWCTLITKPIDKPAQANLGDNIKRRLTTRFRQAFSNENLTPTNCPIQTKSFMSEYRFLNHLLYISRICWEGQLQRKVKNVVRPVCCLMHKINTTKKSSPNSRSKFVIDPADASSLHVFEFHVSLLGLSNTCIVCWCCSLCRFVIPWPTELPSEHRGACTVHGALLTTYGSVAVHFDVLLHLWILVPCGVLPSE